MYGQMIVTNQANFNPSLKMYTLDRVLNKLETNALPFVNKLEVFIKLSFIPIDVPVEIQIVIKDDNQKDITKSETITQYNPRSNDRISGLDFCVRLTTIFCKTGNHMIELFVDGALISIYPIHVRMVEEIYEQKEIAYEEQTSSFS
ncbi:DUF6941 family protein [Paenibacillus alba]|uniref:Uncharacterized protein n=1 Tax=Paenibacillus alba TaxID=1197127 RepID=A0ABU6GEF8_9BACL|nr:hypothetical protein [Paenibacillus alba]MEC0231597.1 hypothetical protein [Paenibacillus alba]